MTGLHVGMVAPLWMRVPPRTYGGAEAIVKLLVDDLVEMGQRVTLFASADSDTRADLVPVCEAPVTDLMAQGASYYYAHHANLAISEALARSAEFDLLHVHLGYEYLPFGRLASCPVVHSVHVLPFADDLRTVGQVPDAHVVALSQAQADPMVAGGARGVTVIHSGTDFGAFEPSYEPGSYLAFLGRMSPGKNPVGAVRVAREAGMPLVMAGVPQNADEEVFFKAEVAPLIDGQAVRYVGSVDHPRKNELLRGAAGLVFPILGDEAFGMVMVEAMACGTPVLGRRHTSVGEVVDQGMTGFVADEVSGLAALVPDLLRLDRREVRERARSRFDRTRVAREYLDLYRRVLAGDS